MKASITSDIAPDIFKMTEQIEDIFEDEVVKLHNDLIDVGEAVRDTGNFKNSFSPIMHPSRYRWVIENDAHSVGGFDYASILARGRLYVNGRWYGSVHWPKGLTPMLRKTARNIKRRVDAL